MAPPATRLPRQRTRLTLAAALAAFLLTASASPAMGSVALGQIGPPAVGQCEGFDTVQATLTTGNSYTVPGDGTITQWSTYGGPNPGTMKLKVFRLIASPATYLAVGHAGPQSVTPNGTAGNTFPANIQVKAGDLLGVNAAGAWCILSDNGGQQLHYMGDLADGASAPFANPATRRLNVQAIFVPDNSFRLTKTTRTKKKGTVTLTFDVPNAGQLAGTGKGAKVSVTSPKPQGSVVAPGSGPSQLVVKAKGKKKRKLNDTGKVKLKLSVTYTPTGGDPSTQSLKVKLKKK
jgi:hypothetical protein